MIHVIATIDVAPGRLADFLQEFHRIVPQVRAEEGCLEYGPAVDAATGIASQQPKGADVVTVIEKWTSIAALEAHLVAPHMGVYRERVRDKVRRVVLNILEPV